MSTEHPLYDPKLVEHLNGRYRRFETDEMIRKLRQEDAALRRRFESTKTPLRIDQSGRRGGLSS